MMRAGEDWEKVVAAYRDLESPLYTYVLRIVRDRRDAADIAGRALARVMQLAHEGRLTKTRGSRRAFAFTAAHDLSLDYRRTRRWVSHPGGGSDTPQDDLPEPAGTATPLDRALERLPEAGRHALLLRVIGELGYADIAHALSTKECQVRDWIGQAREQLATLLDGNGWNIDSEDGTAPEAGQSAWIELSAYLDGELPPADRAAVESNMEKSPSWKAERERFESVDAAIRQCMEPPGSGLASSAGLRRSTVEVIGDYGHRTGTGVKGPVMAAVVLFLLCAILIGVYFRSPENRISASGMAAPVPQAPVRVTKKPVPPSPPKKRVTAPAETARQQTQATGNETPTPVAGTQPLPLALTGTVMGAPPSAVIRNKETGVQKVYRIGQEVMPGVTLKAVYDRSVVLDRNGEDVRLAIGLVSLEAPPVRTVNGLWRLVVAVGGQEESFSDLLRFKQDGKALSVETKGGEAFGKGTIDSDTNAVMIQFVDGDQVYVLQGELDSTWTGLVLHFNGPTPYGASVDPASIELRLTRLEDDAQTLVAKLDAYRSKVEKLRQELDQFARDHDGHYPAELAALVPDYAESINDFTGTQDRKVTYTGGVKKTNFRYDEAPPFDTFQVARPMAERLKNWELVLNDAYGGKEWLNPPIVLRIETKDPEAVFTLTARGDLRVDSPVAVPPPNGRATGVSNDADVNAQISKDQDNLKQLGIIVRMFANEHDGYSPGGWLSVYPEYMTDYSVLTSPRDPAGTDSYRFLLPATNLETLGGSGVPGSSQAAADAASLAKVKTETPVLMDRTDFRGPVTGRNVLFADGHVEFIERNTSEWQAIVAPLLGQPR